VPGKQLANNPANIVLEANLIIWAKATGMVKAQPFESANSPVLYTFEIEEVLKGSIEMKKLGIKGEGDTNGLWDTTFSNHSESNFLEDFNGRLGNIGDCVTTPPPAFKLGRKYLLIIGGMDDSKKYERVDTKEDKWYQKVNSLLNENGI
jgi:hypothetical protein